MKVIVSPPALQLNSWIGIVLQVSASQLRLAGWFRPLLSIHSGAPTPGQEKHAREIPETQAAARVSPPATVAVRLRQGTSRKTRKAKLFFEV